ncbi:MAG: hypothetical protein EBZ48_08420, partial [Proteobacteria bacterium]|nr:hypothetical protein [Pseudomonadota bacterium]
MQGCSDQQLQRTRALVRPFGAQVQTLDDLLQMTAEAEAASSKTGQATDWTGATECIHLCRTLPLYVRVAWFKLLILWVDHLLGKDQAPIASACVDWSVPPFYEYSPYSLERLKLVGLAFGPCVSQASGVNYENAFVATWTGSAPAQDALAEFCRDTLRDVERRVLEMDYHDSAIFNHLDKLILALYIKLGFVQLRADEIRDYRLDGNRPSWEILRPDVVEPYLSARPLRLDPSFAFYDTIYAFVVCASPVVIDEAAMVRASKCPVLSGSCRAQPIFASLCDTRKLGAYFVSAILTGAPTNAFHLVVLAAQVQLGSERTLVTLSALQWTPEHTEDPVHLCSAVAVQNEGSFCSSIGSLASATTLAALQSFASEAELRRLCSRRM